MEEMSDRPKWLLELENRKRKCRLAHEAGAGAPCIVCGSTCPGLDLHFWRKICKNCKCSRDDHDVDDDEFPQFDVLFGPSSKSKNRIMLLPVKNNKNKHVDETAFEWVPPNTTKELAADYMKALPAEKLPIKGSSGAALRKQQLQKQLPLHDVDHKVCDALSEEEEKQFLQYLAELKRYVGQGTVIKALSACPSDHLLMTPASAADMQQFSPQRKLENSMNQVPQLRTPSSFNKKLSYPSLTSHRHQTPIPYDQQSNTGRYKCLLTNTCESDIVRSEAVSGTVQKLSEHIGQELTDEENTSSTNLPEFSQLHQHAQFSDDKCKHAIQMADSTPLKHVKEHFGCSPTRGTLEQLKLNSPQYSAGLKKGAVTNISSNTAKNDETLNDENVLIAESILADALLPPSAIHNNDIIGSTLGQDKLKFIREKLANKYSAQEEVPASISDAYVDSKDNDSVRKDKTKKTIVPSSLRVSAENPLTKDPHDTSINAKSPLSNNPPLNEIYHNGQKYAPPTIISSSKQGHTMSNNANCLQAKLCNDYMPPMNIIHSENLQTQVFPHEMTNAPDQTSQKLPSIEKIQEGIEGLTLKLPKAKRCNKCQEDIKVDDVIVTVEKAENIAWHPGCFVCSTCNELLADLVYFYYKNKLYCGRDFASHLGIPRCFACDELIFVREYTVAEGHNYHVKHFCCWDCDVPLAGRQYVSENDRPLCLPCYESKYANTCDACKTTIAADQKGVAIKNFNFHANDACFCCVTCKKGLLNGRIAVREGKLYCSRECFT